MHLYPDMRMLDPIPQFSHIVTALAGKHTNLAYVHLTEHVKGSILPNGRPNPTLAKEIEQQEASNDFIRKIWAPRPLISCTDYTREKALHVAETKGDLIAFGRLFISNVSELVCYIKGWPLTGFIGSLICLTAYTTICLSPYLIGEFSIPTQTSQTQSMATLTIRSPESSSDLIEALCRRGLSDDTNLAC